MADTGNIKISASTSTTVTVEMTPKDLAAISPLLTRGTYPRGNLPDNDVNTFVQRIRSSPTQPSMLDRVGDAAEKQSTRPPEAYTSSGRYTEAASDADLREGFKGERVKDLQQRMADAGYDLGTSGANGDGVDGFWGPKTQSAYTEYQKGLGPKDCDCDDGTSSPTARSSSPGYQSRIDNKADAVAAATSPDDGRPEKVTRALTPLTNQQIQDVDESMRRRTGTGLKDSIDRMDNDDIAGNGDDYKDLMKKMARGTRNEGADASADDAAAVNSCATVLADSKHNAFMRQFTGDRTKINEVFATASGEQLREIDRMFKMGVRNSDGEIVQYDGGLREYVDEQIGEGAHRDALRAQLERP